MIWIATLCALFLIFRILWRFGALAIEQETYADDNETFYATCGCLAAFGLLVFCNMHDPASLSHLKQQPGYFLALLVGIAGIEGLAIAGIMLSQYLEQRPPQVAEGPEVDGTLIEVQEAPP